MVAILRKPATRTLRKMGLTDRKRILEAIESLEQNPSQKGADKIEGMKNLYRYRIGGRRIIFKRDGNDVDILGIATRGQAYDVRRLQQLDKD